MNVPPAVLRPMCLAALLLPCTAAAARPQPEPPPAVREEIAALRAELHRLRGEVEALREEVRHQRATPAGAGAPVTAPPALEMLGTQVAELARVKVESLSTLRARLFGTIHSHLFTNTGEANWLDLPNLVPARVPGLPPGSFSATLRQSRLGLAVDGPTVGGLRASGTIVADFFGGIPGFQTGQPMGLPRLLVAFARLEGERTAALIGQDHAVLAPRDPTSLASLAFPALFRSGNLYLRVPQVRLERTIVEGLRVTGALLAPVGGDLAGEDYRFVPPALGGERSRRPALQAHLGYARASEDARRALEIGVSGHHGWERQGERLADSWAAAVDFAARRDWLGVAGELFRGENVDAFGGATGLPARAAGGWAELRVLPADRWSLNVGAGVDRVVRVAPALPRTCNRGAYANAIFAVTPELRASLEYQWLGTRPGQGAERRNHHLAWVFAYEF